MATRARANYELAATDKTGAAFASVDRRLEGARQSIMRMGGATLALGAASAAGLVPFTKRLIEQGDAMHKATIRTGIMAEELSALHQIAALNDVSSEAFNDTIFKMNRNLGEAADGTGEQADAMKALGLDTAELLRQSPAERFLAIADALSQLGDDGQFASVGQALLGRGIKDLTPLIKAGREEIARLSAELQENPIFTQEQAQAAADAADAFTVLGNALQREQNKALPALAGYAQAGADIATAVLPSLGSAAEGLMTLLGTPFAMAMTTFDDGVSSLDVLKQSATDLARAFGAMDEIDEANRNLDKMIDTALKADAAFAQAGKAITGDFIDPLSIALDAVSLTPGAGTAGARAMIDDQGNAFDPARVVSVAMQMLQSGAGLVEGTPGSVGRFGQVDRNRFVAGADTLARPQKVEDPEQRRILEDIRDLLRQGSSGPDERFAVFA